MTQKPTYGIAPEESFAKEEATLLKTTYVILPEESVDKEAESSLQTQTQIKCSVENC